jgi:hypothetical protein
LVFAGRPSLKLRSTRVKRPALVPDEGVGGAKAIARHRKEAVTLRRPSLGLTGGCAPSIQLLRESRMFGQPSLGPEIERRGGYRADGRASVDAAFLSSRRAA